MTLSEAAHRRRPVVFMLLVVLMGLGVASYLVLPAREDPAVTIREAVITTAFPGLAPERMERLVTRTLEEAIREVPEVEEIRSTTMTGISIIHVEILDVYFDLDQIWDEVRQKIDAAAPDLPQGTAPPVMNDDFGDVAVLTLALTADGFDLAAMADMADHVRDVLYQVPGTRRIDILGGIDERIYVDADPARLAELGISADGLAATLADQNVITPGGEVEAAGQVFAIQPSGNYESVEDVRNTLIRLPGSGEVVPLADIAEVRRMLVDPPPQRAYHNGRPAIVLAVAMQPDRRVLAFAAEMRALVAETAAALPVGYRLEIITDQSVQVGNAVFGVSRNVVQTLAIVLAVVVLFLGVRTGLIVGSIVPAVMLVTLAIMGFAGLTLERMSLATLVIALGLLVDNGIVMAEDFKRRLEEGASRDEALAQSGRELALPLLSSTLTTILVFLPLMMADHVAGEYTRAISLVILITLSVSWLVAMTVTPTLCHRFIRIDPHPANGESRRPRTEFFVYITKFYQQILRRILRHRRAFLALMAVLLVGAAAAMGTVPKRFFPLSDRAQVLVYLDLPAGVSSRTTDSVMRQILAAVDASDRLGHVEGHVGYVGFGGPRFVLSLTPIDPAPHRAFMVFSVGEERHVDATIAGLRALFRDGFPEVSARVTRMFLGPSDSTKLEVQVRGPDAGVLYAAAADVEGLLRALPGAIEIRHDWENRVSRFVVDVDQTRARRAGVTSADVARAMDGFFSGRTVSAFRDGDDIFPIIARGRDAARHDLERLRTLPVHPAGGGGDPVPLMQVADLRLANDFAVIAREDMVRTVTVEARNLQLTAEDMVPLIQPRLDALAATLPAAHHIELDGVVVQSAEGRAALAANLPLCIGAMLVLFVAQFNGFRRPAIIVATIPLVLIGAVAGLLVSGASFGFMPLLGLYALAGIIVNNAIVLIDRIEIERAQPGADPFEAIVAAAGRRVRPILMSTITTILGLSPLIVGVDPLFFGMASAIAGGLLVGTILTLGVAPVLYSLLFAVRPAGPAGSAEPLAVTHRIDQPVGVGP